MRILAALVLTLSCLAAGQAAAFCGFYVARGDAKLFNEASKVVMVRDGNRTVITMVNDFQGDVKDFAMVIPAPTVLKRKQINVSENAIIEHLDAYTAPRLVEYFDGDPCRRPVPTEGLALSAAPAESAVQRRAGDRAKALGVKIEAEYSVGEYDILILSAKQSRGLTTWLNENGYRLPDGAVPVLGGYIDAGMKFFVARVNLEAHAKSGNTFLRPLQIAFEAEGFMLPIRLGMLNAKGSQDLLLWTLTRSGRVETANYRTVKMPTGNQVPIFVKDDFGRAYKAMFAEQVRREGGAAVMLEYAWDMAWCDPCAADPLSNRELRELGAFWVPKAGDARPSRGVDVYVTRLHVRYDSVSFPEDLRLLVTSNRENFQGRYVLRHPWKGEAQCSAGREYRASLPGRFEREAQTLANLTGWPIEDVRDRMTKAGTAPGEDPTWWEKLWDN